jgi:aryl-alcohol dehydrogenase-like predicted oxidoreductase
MVSAHVHRPLLILDGLAVRVGKSGLKVSRIILGCMSYGSSEWSPWVLGEEEGIKQIKAA